MSGRIIGELVLPDNPTGKHFTDDGTWADIPAPIPGPPGDPGPKGDPGDPGPAGATLLAVPFHADGSANLTLTNSPLAERFVLNTPGRFIKWAPLAGCAQVRLRGNVITQSTSANSPRVRLLYKAGAYSATLGNFSAIGASEVSLSLTGTGDKDSGWINLAAGAQAECFVALTELGGDGALDPALGHVTAYFK